MSSTSPAPVQYPVTTGRYVPGYISTDDLRSATLTASGNVSVGGTLSATGTLTATGGVSGPLNGITYPSAPGIGQALAATSSTALAFVSAKDVGGWIFDVRKYGAKGDGQAVADGAMTSGQPTLTCATSKPFKSTDVNKNIMVAHAGATGVTTLLTTIAGYTSPSVVTLGANAAGNVSGVTVLWGTDDTAAIQAAVNDATAYGQLCGSATVYFPPIGDFYAVAGPLVTSATWNSQITIPIVGTPAVANTQNKVVLTFAGSGNGAATRHWQQLVPTTGGSCIVSFGAFASAGAQTISLNAGGQASCIGGPTGANGYGTNVQTPDASGSVFNNVMPIMSGISVLTTHTANGIGYGALNFHGCCAAALFDFGYGTTGTHAGNDFNNPITFANGLVVGVVMPASGNNDCLLMRGVTCHGGYTRGIFLTEHTNWKGGTMLYCWSGICPVGDYGDGGTGTGAFHGIQFESSVEGCTQIVEIIGPGAGGTGPQIFGVIDNEGTPAIVDNSFPVANGLASAVGELRLQGGGGTVSTNLGTGLVIINDVQAPGPVAGLTLTINTAIQNTYWRPAQVIVSGGTGITTIQLGNTMGGASAPSLTTILTQTAGVLAPFNVHIPPGGWIKVNGATAPASVWYLD